MIEYPWAAGNEEHLPELAAELVRLKLDAILAPTTLPALAAMRKTSTVPFVFAAAANPIGMQLSPFTSDHRKRIVELAALHRLPAMFETRASVEIGGLMCYGPSEPEMVLNLKTAKALGLTVPYALRLQATEMIE